MEEPTQQFIEGVIWLMEGHTEKEILGSLLAMVITKRIPYGGIASDYLFDEFFEDYPLPRREIVK